jgi:hypothetical protein
MCNIGDFVLDNPVFNNYYPQTATGAREIMQVASWSVAFAMIPVSLGAAPP